MTMTFEYGYLPWKKGYGGFCRAVRWSNGNVARIGAKNTLYPVSEKLARQFRTQIQPHPVKALIEEAK
jgi:hypothetical protein